MHKSTTLAISPSGDLLVYATDSEDREADLYAVTRGEDSWGEAVRLIADSPNVRVHKRLS